MGRALGLAGAGDGGVCKQNALGLNWFEMSDEIRSACFLWNDQDNMCMMRRSKLLAIQFPSAFSQSLGGLFWCNVALRLRHQFEPRLCHSSGFVNPDRRRSYPTRNFLTVALRKRGG